MLSPQVVVSNDPPLGDAIPSSVDDTFDVCDESRLELLGDSLVHQTRCTEGTDGVSDRTDSRLSNVSISGPSKSTSCPQCPVMLPIKDLQVIQPKNQILALTPHHPFGVSFVAKSKSSSSGRQKAAFIKSKLIFVQSSAQSRRNKSRRARKKAKKQNDLLIPIEIPDGYLHKCDAPSIDTIVFVDGENVSNPRINPRIYIKPTKLNESVPTPEVVIVPISAFIVPLDHLPDPQMGLSYSIPDCHREAWTTISRKDILLVPREQAL